MSVIAKEAEPMVLKMAGVAGLEPTHHGIKIRCLTDLAIPLIIIAFKTVS